MQGAAREEELYYCLGLDEVQRSGSGRHLHLQMCVTYLSPLVGQRPAAALADVHHSYFSP